VRKAERSTETADAVPGRKKFSAKVWGNKRKERKKVFDERENEKKNRESGKTNRPFCSFLT